MTIATISREELTLKIFDLLAMIAPEADFDELDANDDVRDELDIDSFDFLNFLIDLNDEVGVEIPEADYGKLVSLNDLLDYLLAQMS
jgi:acyl carrier protein